MSIHSELIGQKRGQQRFLSAGYTVPIEANNLSDGIHSLALYCGLKNSGDWILGLTGTAGFDLHTKTHAFRQEMFVISGFARYLIQDRSIKSYAEIKVGQGYFREIATSKDTVEPSESFKLRDNFLFSHLNIGGGVDIPFGDSNWYLGLGGAYSVVFHREGTGAFFVPRIAISRY